MNLTRASRRKLGERQIYDNNRIYREEAEILQEARS